MKSVSRLTKLAMDLSRVWLLCLCIAVVTSVGAPARGFGAGKDPTRDQLEAVHAIKELKEQLKKLRELPGLDKEEYLRYWKEAVKSDPRFDDLRKLGDLKHGDEKVDIERLVQENPHLSERLARHSNDVRSRLEEAKRMNIEEMRQLHRMQMLKDDKAYRDADLNSRLEGLRERLPPRFRGEDIQKRIREQNKLMGEIDEERRAEFKHAEMAAEHRRRELLKAMDEKKRLEAEEEFQKRQAKLRGHEKLHHPASEQQLEDVWEKEDGLERDKFDKRTFFHLHDTNSDKYMDAMEWESLFYNELRKVYGDDMGGMEAHEDLARMREHVMKEMDTDKDGMVSLQEFMFYADNSDFKDDEPWKSVVEEDPFDETEFKKYEEDYPDYYDYEYDEHGNLIGYKTKQKPVHEEEAPDKHPPKVNEHANEQGQPPAPGNDQGHPPVQVNEQGQPPKREGVPGINQPQIEDPKAVHFNGVDGQAAGDIPAGDQNL